MRSCGQAIHLHCVLVTCVLLETVRHLIMQRKTAKRVILPQLIRRQGRLCRIMLSDKWLHRMVKIKLLRKVISLPSSRLKPTMRSRSRPVKSLLIMSACRKEWLSSSPSRRYLKCTSPVKQEFDYRVRGIGGL